MQPKKEEDEKNKRKHVEQAGENTVAEEREETEQAPQKQESLVRSKVAVYEAVQSKNKKDGVNQAQEEARSPPHRKLGLTRTPRKQTQLVKEEGREERKRRRKKTKYKLRATMERQ